MFQCTMQCPAEALGVINLLSKDFCTAEVAYVTQENKFVHICARLFFPKDLTALCV